MLSKHDVVTRSPEHISCEVEGKAVILNSQTGEFYDLNSSATLIWDTIAQPISVSDLCVELQKSFNVNSDQCEKETLDLLLRLQSKELVVIVE